MLASNRNSLTSQKPPLESKPEVDWKFTQNGPEINPKWTELKHKWTAKSNFKIIDSWDRKLCLETAPSWLVLETNSSSDSNRTGRRRDKSEILGRGADDDPNLKKTPLLSKNWPENGSIPSKMDRKKPETTRVQTENGSKSDQKLTGIWLEATKRDEIEPGLVMK